MRSRLLAVELVMFMALTHGAIPNEMLSHMNTSVHPCDDFYQYSCGNWIKIQKWGPTVIDNLLVSTKLQEHSERVIHDIVKENPPLVGELWDSCMAIDKINAIGNEPLQKDLHRIAHAEDRTELFELVGTFALAGTKTILSFDVIPDRNNAKIHTLAASPAKLLLPDVEYYSTDVFPTIETEYRTYIHQLLKISGYHASTSAAVDAIVKIDKDIAKIYKEFKGYSRAYLPIHEANSKWPTIFAPYVKGLGIQITPRGWFSKGEQVQVLNIAVVDKLEKLVHAMPMDNLKLYVAFTLIHSRVLWLGDAFINSYFKFFHQKLLGQEERRSRHDFCIHRLNRYLPRLIGTYFYDRTFDLEKKQRVITMTKLIQEAMYQHIDRAHWLDYSTRNKAKKKLDKVLYLVGQSKIPQQYPFTLSREHFAANVHTILLHSYKTTLEKKNKPVVREEWDISPAEVNAYYVPLENKIVLPAAILQPPLFQENVHPARNFGAIGTYIGHELTHGFDNTGRKFDGDGNLNSWWSGMTDKEFTSRSDLMVQQYSNFEVKGQDGVVLGKVKGHLTLAENIADNGGLSLAWDAYREYMTRFKPETNGVSAEEGEQLFFLAFGQSYCSKTRDETIRNRLITDPHSPDQWRVNGAVMNNDNFAKVFKCAVNAPMNPTVKRKIW